MQTSPYQPNQGGVFHLTLPALAQARKHHADPFSSFRLKIAMIDNYINQSF
jgi:hypothetical protein